MIRVPSDRRHLLNAKDLIRFPDRGKAAVDRCALTARHDLHNHGVTG